jgi:hypothetical protein
MKQPPEKIREIVINMALLLGTLVVLFVVLEVGLRGICFINEQKSFETLKKTWPQPKNGVAEHMGMIVQPSRYEDIVYELRPDLSARFMDVLVRTNTQGFRSDAVSVEKPKNVARVVVLGDSHMFGWGVPQDKACPHVLQEILNQKYQQKRWEVINAAVPGYNTVMEIATLEKKALQYRPDIVVLEFIGNDLDLPDFLLKGPECFDLKQSYIMEFIKRKLAVLQTNVDMVAAPLAGDGRCEHDPAKIPEKYRHMVGASAFVRSMTLLKKIQDKEHFEVVICVSQAGPSHFLEFAKNLCKKLNFHMIIDMQKIEPELILSMKDKHPSILAHYRKAGVLLNFMAKERILDRVIAGQKYSAVPVEKPVVEVSVADIQKVTELVISSLNKGDLSGASGATSIDTVRLGEFKKIFENIQIEGPIGGDELSTLHRECWPGDIKWEERCIYIVKEDSEFLSYNISVESVFRVMINGKVQGVLMAGFPVNEHQVVIEPRIVKLAILIGKKNNDATGYAEIVDRIAEHSMR